MTNTTYIRSRPIGVFWACVLILAAAAYSLVTNFTQVQTTGVFEELGNAALAAFFVWGLLQRKNWVRLVFLAFALLVPLALMIVYSLPVQQLITNVSVILSLICVVLLIMPSSSRWFHKRKK